MLVRAMTANKATPLMPAPTLWRSTTRSATCSISSATVKPFLVEVGRRSRIAKASRKGSHGGDREEAGPTLNPAARRSGGRPGRAREPRPRVTTRRACGQTLATACSSGKSSGCQHTGGAVVTQPVEARSRRRKTSSEGILP